MTATPIKTSHQDGVTRITLDRPEVRNAMSPELIEQLNETIRGLGSVEGLRSVVIQGSDPCFCSGMDLKTAGTDPQAMRGMLRGLADTMIEIRRLEVPVIARVQGAAVGGGCGLMTGCDFVVSHPDAKLGYPEVDHGICPAVVAPWLVRKIGGGRARALLLSGGTITGQAGFDIGLVSHLVAREEIDQTVDRLVERIDRGGANALAVTKRWLNQIENANLEEELVQGADISADVLAGPEAQERLARSRKR